MKKIKEWIKNFISKYIVAEDPCYKKEKDDYIKNGYWEEGRIYERNPDTNEVKSRKVGDYGNEKKEVPAPIKRKRGRPKKTATKK